MIIYRFGPFRLEREQLLLSLRDEPLALGPKVVETMLALVEHPGEVLSKTELLDRVWPEGFVEEANLAQNIYVIRKTLRAHWDRDAIETVPRRGYRFVGDVCLEATKQAHSSEPHAAAPVRTMRSLRYAIAVVLAAAAVVITAIGVGTANGTHSRTAPVATQGLSPTGARLYAIGKFYWNQRTASSVTKSLRYFQSVAQSDPHDARGYAGLASAYAIDADYGFGGLTKKAALLRAASYARAALRIDPNSAEAHAVVGLVSVENENMKRGFAEYRRALALDPSYAPAHQWIGASLLLTGKTRAAYEELQTAVNLDPESVAATDWLAQASLISRRYRDAIAYGRQTLDLSPQRSTAYETIGLAYEALGNYRAAMDAYGAYGRISDSHHYYAAADLAHVYAIRHDARDAQRELEIAMHGVALGQMKADNVVPALVAMGRKEDALHVLRTVKSDKLYTELAADPRMDVVRNDPRFRQYTQGPG